MAVVAIVIGITEGNKIEELAQSICDQKYDMDYESYNNKELKCKPREPKQEIAYDGIVIKIS